MKNFLKKNALLKLILLAILVYGLVIVFGDQVKFAGNYLVTEFGLMGLFVGTFLMDFLIQPFSPDMLVFSFTFADSPFLITSFVGGISSVLAGVAGHFAGRRIVSDEAINRFIGKKNFETATKLFEKHGFLAVLIGSISPIPFSAICWSSGVFKMPVKYFILSAFFTRLPRFLIAGYLGYAL